MYTSRAKSGRQLSIPSLALPLRHEHKKKNHAFALELLQFAQSKKDSFVKKGTYLSTGIQNWKKDIHSANLPCSLQRIDHTWLDRKDGERAVAYPFKLPSKHEKKKLSSCPLNLSWGVIAVRLVDDGDARSLLSRMDDKAIAVFFLSILLSQFNLQANI